ncbi:MAG: ferrous iron transport protein B [Promethearchaeota archaeon]
MARPDIETRPRRRRWQDPQLSEEFSIALVGNPNVGKSVIFNSWTGLGAMVSNYPGTTVEILEGTVFFSIHDVYKPGRFQESDISSSEENGESPPLEPGHPATDLPPRGRGRGRFRRRGRDLQSGYGVGRGRRRRRKWRADMLRLRIVDLPGSYTIISPTSLDEQVTLRYLQQDQPDAIVNVVDATNLQRNLIMTIALLEFDIPLVVCLNQVDLARKMGINIDVKALERLLGVPVVPTVASQGKNLRELLRVAAGAAIGRRRHRRRRRMIFPDGIEAKLVSLEKQLESINFCPMSLPPRIVSQQMLEGETECIQCANNHEFGKQAMEYAAKLRKQIEEEFGEDIVLVLGEKRRDYASYIAERVQKGEGHRVPLTEHISEVLTHKIWGLPIVLLVLVGSLLLIFAVGSLFEDTVGAFWDTFIDPAAVTLIETWIPWPIVQTILYYGIVLGIQGWLFIAVPYVVTFYVILSVMEDTGYMARVAFLLDGLMHRMGLHGRAIIPLFMGMGCNVPAVLGNRILTTKKERVIAGFLVVLVPCSAQLSVIMGTVAQYGNIFFAFIIYGIVIAIIFLLGALLQHTVPGKSFGLVMEMPPLRLPRPKPTFKKTWIRFKEFLYVALPFIMVGSAILGVLLESDLLYLVVLPASPLIVGWLGLPAVTAIALIYGILRKELTVELLLVLATPLSIGAFMTIRQMFVFSLVTTIYVPCMATIGVLAKEYGWKYTTLIVATSVILAFLAGGLANHVLLALGIS